MCVGSHFFPAQQTKVNMAIFGKQGLQAAALYLAVIWATYAQKKAGFADKAEYQAVWQVVDRKQLSSGKLKGKEYADAAKAARAQRYAAIIARGEKRTGTKGVERYKELKASKEFLAEQSKLTYMR